jgi:hypothetical protein
VTDAGLAVLAGPDAKTVDTLTSINLSGCQIISNQVRTGSLWELSLFRKGAALHQDKLNFSNRI